jgi:hypothetical protein
MIIHFYDPISFLSVSYFLCYKYVPRFKLKSIVC